MTQAAQGTSVPEILAFGAAEAAGRLRAREFSSTELCQAVIDRIEAVNPRVNAIHHLLGEQALRAAAAADRRLAAGTPIGPLDGVPITVKENLDVAGTATTQGVSAFADAVAASDAPSVASLRAAGAIPIARTNLCDFALRWHTDSGIGGLTLNPYDARLTPGGSSGGESVSLATGMSMLGIGTDLGGSLRWPSQCAGTAALRPTLGRIPQAASIEPTTLPISLQLLDVQGPMARRIQDLRLALRVMTAPECRDPWHSPVPASYLPETPRRVHVLHEIAGVEFAPAVQDAIRRAADALHADGYEIVDQPPPGLVEAAQSWASLLMSDARRVWPALAEVAAAGGIRFMELMFEIVPAVDLDGYAELLHTRHRLGRAWSEYQHHTPLVLAPIFAGAPFASGSDLDGPEAARAIVTNLRATLAVNFLGLPAVAVPTGLADDGLPQAVQIIGPRFGEELCLRAGEAIEKVTGPCTPVDPR